MKTMYKTAAIATFALSAMSLQAFSAEGPVPPKYALQDHSFEKVVQVLNDAGYRDIYEIEWDSGYVEAKVRDENGRILELAVAPDTSEIIKQKYEEEDRYYRQTVSPKISLEQALQILKDGGFGLIKEIELEKGYYEAEVLGETGSKKEIYVDAQSGQILSGWQAFKK